MTVFTADDYRETEARMKRCPTDGPTPCLTCADDTIVRCSAIENATGCATFKIFSERGKVTPHVMPGSRCGECASLNTANNYCFHRKRTVRVIAMPCSNYKKRRVTARTKEAAAVSKKWLKVKVGADKPRDIGTLSNYQLMRAIEAMESDRKPEFYPHYEQMTDLARRRGLV